MKHLFSIQSIKQPVSLAGQLFLSHLIAGGIALLILTKTLSVEPVPRNLLALAAAGIAGLLLTLNIQRSLSQATAALNRLAHILPGPELSPGWHWPLTDLITHLNTLAGHQRETGELRENLLRQTGEAAAQEERHRLARDLHDSIKQQIFSIQVSAAAVQARWDQDSDGAKTALADVRQRAQEALVEMNALLQQLSPAPLEKVGLIQALRDQCEALGYRTGATVTVEIGDLPGDDRLPLGTQETLFRIAQEALSNVARHARADNVWLKLQQDKNVETLRLEIEDDGQGFDIRTATDGMGLSNIRQRVQSLAGTLDVTGTPGQGASLQINIPLLQPVEVEEEEIYQPDPTARRVMLVGLGGGLALIAALFYPLYILLPGQYVAEWADGSAVLGLLSQVVAAAIGVGTGYVGARWAGISSRPKGVLLGALAGGLAATILFLGLGAGAARVMGSGLILERGLAPAASEPEFLKLVVEYVIGLIWWSFSMFWAMALAGIGLGALGGMLAPIAADDLSRQNIQIENLARDEGFKATMAFFAISTVTFLVSVGYTLGLEELFLETLLDLETAPRLPLSGVVNLPLWMDPTGLSQSVIFLSLPLVTSGIFHLTSFAVLLVWLWSKSRTGDSKLLSQVNRNTLGAIIIVSLCLIGSLGWLILRFNNPDYAIRTASGTSVWVAGISLSMSAILLVLAFALYWHTTSKLRLLTGQDNRFVISFMTTTLIVSVVSLALFIWTFEFSSQHRIFFHSTHFDGDWFLYLVGTLIVFGIIWVGLNRLHSQERQRLDGDIDSFALLRQSIQQGRLFQYLTRLEKFALASLLVSELIIFMAIIIGASAGAWRVAEIVVFTGFMLMALGVTMFIVSLVRAIKVRRPAVTSTKARQSIGVNPQQLLSSLGENLIGIILRAVIMVIALLAGLGAFMVALFNQNTAIIISRVGAHYTDSPQSNTPAVVTATVTDLVQSSYLSQVQAILWAILIAIILIGLYLLGKIGFSYLKPGFSYVIGQFKQG